MKKPDLHQLVNRIKESAIFKDIPEEQLFWLAQNTEHFYKKKGDYLLRTGDPIDRMYILLNGSVAYVQKQNGNSRTLDEVHSGEVTGALPYSRATKAIADTQALEDLEALSFPQGHFKELIHNHYQLTEALVHIMTTRVREFTRTQQQLDKMAALGKLSAGLAHELNNPASAAVRSSDKMKELLVTVPRTLQQLLATKPAPELIEKLQLLSPEVLEETKGRGGKEEIEEKPGGALSLLDRSSLIDEQAEWLESHGLEDPYNLAEVFSASGINLNELQQLEEAQKLNTPQLKAALNWLSKILSMTKLAEEIQFSSKRISELVNAVKSYSHMDRSPEKEMADLRKGIADTLTMLNFKIRKKGIKVETNFPDDLPAVCVFAGELNQLWTNLIDNAIDALKDGGKLSISLSHSQEQVTITIEDNGEGIPQKIQDKIFDPFFTTKPSGKGSGMGLEIAKNIVDDHEGDIRVASEAGKTVFTISLPR